MGNENKEPDHHSPHCGDKHSTCRNILRLPDEWMRVQGHSIGQEFDSRIQPFRDPNLANRNGQEAPVPKGNLEGQAQGDDKSCSQQVQPRVVLSPNQDRDAIEGKVEAPESLTQIERLAHLSFDLARDWDNQRAKANLSNWKSGSLVAIRLSAGSIALDEEEGADDCAETSQTGEELTYFTQVLV